MREWLEEISKRRDKNYKVLSLVASYLNNYPHLVTKETIDDITNGNKSGEQRAFYSFLANVFSEDTKEIRWLEREYLSKSVKCLSPDTYLKNPFLTNIKVPSVKVNNWDFGYQTYKAYEGFIYRDLLIEGYTEIPQIGYFENEFSFPTVFENGVEWMAIKPNEIETMKEPIDKARGKALVYGLGIGYFAYMISQKENVKSVTVIERDENAISLFKEHILNQFPNKDKIRIIKSDAFEYAREHMANGKYDYVFTDLWHDVSDGVDLYLKMKKYEDTCPNSQFEYWIERSILSSIRWSIFQGIYKKAQEGIFECTKEELDRYLSFEYLKKFVKYI